MLKNKDPGVGWQWTDNTTAIKHSHEGKRKISRASWLRSKGKHLNPRLMALSDLRFLKGHAEISSCCTLLKTQPQFYPQGDGERSVMCDETQTQLSWFGCNGHQIINISNSPETTTGKNWFTNTVMLSWMILHTSMQKKKKKTCLK